MDLQSANDEVSDISEGAGERIGGMVNATGLSSGSIAKSRDCGGGSSVGAETHINNELAEVGEVLGSWQGRGVW